MASEIDDQVRILVADREIRALVYRYCRAIDRRQYDLLRSCYHPDATDHHGDFYGGVEEFVSYVQQNLPAFERTLHFIGNLQVEISGETARTEAYVLALARLAASDDAPGDWSPSGRAGARARAPQAPGPPPPP